HLARALGSAVAAGGSFGSSILAGIGRAEPELLLEFARGWLEREGWTEEVGPAIACAFEQVARARPDLRSDMIELVRAHMPSSTDDRLAEMSRCLERLTKTAAGEPARSTAPGRISAPLECGRVLVRDRPRRPAVEAQLDESRRAERSPVPRGRARTESLHVTHEAVVAREQLKVRDAPQQLHDARQPRTHVRRRQVVQHLRTDDEVVARQSGHFREVR